MKTIVSKRLRKNGKPRAPYTTKTYNKPKDGCAHDWRLVDFSAVPCCKKCDGHALIGTYYHTQAFVEARMKSDRPSPPSNRQESAYANED